MKHRQEKYPTNYGPEDNLPGYGIAKTIRLNLSSRGQAHLAAVTKEELRRYKERRAAETRVADTTEAQVSTAAPQPARQAERKPSHPAVNRAKVMANYAISGDRTSPFENVEPTKPMSERARRIVRRVGYTAAAAVGIAGVTAAAIAGARGIASHEATQARVHAEQQKELGKVVEPSLIKIGDTMYRAYSDWHAKHPGDTGINPAFTEQTLPGNRVEIIANGSSNEVVMGTKVVDGQRVADPSQTKYAWVHTAGNGTIANQYYLGAPGGSEYLPSDITTYAVGSGDYFESASGPGLDGVMSLEDTTNYNDAVDGTDFTSPAALAQDINTNYGLNDVLAEWDHNPNAVNSNANPNS